MPGLRPDANRFCARGATPRGMDVTVSVLAFLTGLLAGAVFAYLQVPIPAPPTVSGVLGIVGIYTGFKLVEYVGAGFDLLGALGL